MRKFIITSPRFSGQAELVYDANGLLRIIDLTGSDMDGMITGAFKKAVPVESANLRLSFSSETVIIEADFEVTFEMFWKEYPLHRNRYKVQEIWKKLSKPDQVIAYYSISDYKKYLSRNEWQKPMIGDRYLRTREFETEWSKIK